MNFALDVDAKHLARAVRALIDFASDDVLLRVADGSARLIGSKQSLEYSSLIGSASGSGVAPLPQQRLQALSKLLTGRVSVQTDKGYLRWGSYQFPVHLSKPSITAEEHYLKKPRLLTSLPLSIFRNHIAGVDAITAWHLVPKELRETVPRLIQFESNGKQVRSVATNALTTSFLNTDFASPPCTFILHGDAIDIAMRMSGSHVEVYSDKGVLCLRAGSDALVFEKWPGQFLKYDRILPKKPTTVVTVDKNELLECARVVRPLGDPEHPILTFTVDAKGKMLTVESATLIKGQKYAGVADAAARVAGSKNDCSVQADLLLPFLEQAAQSPIEIRIVNNKTTVDFRANKGKYRFLQMPSNPAKRTSTVPKPTDDRIAYAINWDADGTACIENAHAIYPAEKKITGQLAEHFGVPPFDVFQVTTATWAARKEKWTYEAGVRGGVVGIRGEDGRDSDVDEDGHVQVASFAGQARLQEIQGRTSKKPKRTDGTSVFDPVLCEIGYRWFCPKGGSILDPFAGGSTRGIVAAYLGYKYTGIEIREGQIDANRKQYASVKARHDKMFAREIAAGTRQPMLEPTWIKGNSGKLNKLLPKGEQYDLLFTCPPYFDLEVYSAKDGDGSRAETYEEFMLGFEDICRQAVGRLRDSRFAVVTVGDVRNKVTRAYRLFPEDTTILFARKLGLVPYNKGVLYTSIGSLPLRTAAVFRKNRRLGHAYQEVKVFWKGEESVDAVKDALGELAPIEVADVY